MKGGKAPGPSFNSQEDDEDGDVVRTALGEGGVHQHLGRGLGLAVRGSGRAGPAAEVLADHVDGLLVLQHVPHAVAGDDDELGLQREVGKGEGEGEGEGE